MLFAKFFPAYVYPINEGSGAYDDWTGGGGGLVSKSPEYSTGRGGITFKDDGTLGVNGEPGRPGASDAVTSPASPSLCGDGGYLDAGGQGLHNGQLFFGGNATSTTSPVFGTTSAGGGSGLFGGGSAFIMAGGGGGSSWVLSNTDPGQMGLRAILRQFPKLTPPDWLGVPIWIGIDPTTSKYYNRNKALFDINTYHLYEYEYKGYKSSLGPAYQAFTDLHTLAGGNGLILISRPNETIEINKDTGNIDGIGDIIKYTGQCVAWTPPEQGVYEFILWGAQGGTVFYTTPDDANFAGQSYTGGFGGSIGFFIELSPTHTEIVDDVEQEVDTTLFLRVGEMGKYVRLQNSWNGGGNGDTASSGGGSTDVRWYDVAGDTGWQANYQYRLAVAGGGGGAIGSGTGGTPIFPAEPGDTGNTKPLDPDIEEDVPIVPDPNDEPLYFLVNDRSLVYVTIKYYSSASLPTNSHAGCLLYINNGQEGVLYEEFKIDPVSGTVEIVYSLDQVYPANTPTHWVTLTPEVRTNTQFIVPSGGVHIRVETRKGVNEPDVPQYKPLVLTLVDTLYLNDTVGVKVNEVTGDIYITITDELLLNDTIGVMLQAIDMLHLTIEEELAIKDIAQCMLESGPTGDIDLSILENLNLVEQVSNNLVQLSIDNDSNSEMLYAQDVVYVRLEEQQ